MSLCDCRERFANRKEMARRRSVSREPQAMLACESLIQRSAALRDIDAAIHKMHRQACRRINSCFLKESTIKKASQTREAFPFLSKCFLPAKQTAVAFFYIIVLRKRRFHASVLPQAIQVYGGAGGIRTHVPRTANGFRVRLVMTTSIPLRNN